ncbi:hypothetical protein N5W20_09180 [Candidatus Kirkpatrickella diaphorinae]|uniref:Uncharacterized protein n=1 Tax=Candidatus Kirkpatrickella diaphorinae TaxID=2984322 RepID=A0ABY6GIA2_9PROT|nr:hypothetical protein [Candidatus Kirkpatrickella diaphorinae]UYH51243.1 hypothetical protein N5W20_09180 [Candidatus Kirkpatrickella diaphorinae]
MSGFENVAMCILGIASFSLLLSIARILHRQAPVVLCLLLLLPGIAMAITLVQLACASRDDMSFYLAGISAAPLCLLPLAARQRQRDPTSTRTARGLGASGWQRFRLDFVPFYCRAAIMTALLILVTCVACIVWR